MAWKTDSPKAGMREIFFAAVGFSCGGLVVADDVGSSTGLGGFFACFSGDGSVPEVGFDTTAS